jgi:carbon-monoxide dehydrogenase iron sulfur subunit
MKTVFVYPEQCIGCKQCEFACAVAHSQSKNQYLAALESPLPKPRIHAEPGFAYATSFPNKCRHCDPAPCQMVCPTNAIQRAADFPEIVLIESLKCIACGMCAIVCPFDAISFYPVANAPGKKNVAVKCDGCIGRQQQGLQPACVEACKASALRFGDLNELIQQARGRYSWEVSAAINLGSGGEKTGVAARLPGSVREWRDWGKVVSALNANGKKERA